MPSLRRPMDLTRDAERALKLPPMPPRDRRTLPDREPPADLLEFAQRAAEADGWDADDVADFVARVRRSWKLRWIYGGRVCTKCDELKPVTAFSSDPRTVDGRTRDCKTCRATRVRARRAERSAAA